jgi:hypothetical protein
MYGHKRRYEIKEARLNVAWWWDVAKSEMEQWATTGQIRREEKGANEQSVLLRVTIGGPKGEGCSREEWTNATLQVG